MAYCVNGCWSVSNAIGIGTITPSQPIEIRSSQEGLWMYRDGGASNDVRFRSSNGTNASPSAKTNGQLMGQLHFEGYDGSSYLSFGGIWSDLDGTVSTGNMPTTLRFFTGTTSRNERMRITSGGNVGIGTSTPTSRLTIAPATNGLDSSIEFTNADNAVISSHFSQTFVVNNTFTQAGRAFVFASGGKGYANNCRTLMIIDADTSNIDVRNGGAFSVFRSDNARKGCLFTDGSGTKLSSDATGNDPLFLIAPGGTGQIRMCAGGNTTMAIGPSNVGIGTTAPASRLTVAGDVGIGSSIGSSTYSGPSQYGAITFPRAQLLFSNTNSQAQFYFVSNATLNSSSQFTYTCNGRAGKINIDDGAISLDVASCAAAGGVISWTNGITVLNNGNVGIGITSPTVLFQVRGPNATGTFFDAQNDGAGGATFSRINASSFPFNQYTFSNGNVGIGTSSPGERLVVDGTQGTIQLRTDSSDGSTINVRPDAGRCGWVSFTEDAVADRWGVGIKNGDSKLYFASGNVASGGGTTRMVLDGSGNLGVGTQSPSQRLHVTGRAIISNGTGTNESLSVGTTSSSTGTNFGTIDINGLDYSGLYLRTNDSIRFGIFQTGGVTSINSITNIPLTFGTCDTERIRITNSGNVGISTSSPSYRLHVNGTFYAAGSSQDYKQGICQYNTDSCLFMCLKPKTYQYKDEWKHLGKDLKSETQIGLIAEEVAEVMPELAILVNEDDNKVVRNVDYEKLSIVLLAEVQKLRHEMDELKQKN